MGAINESFGLLPWGENGDVFPAVPTLRERVIWARNRLGLTQQALADRAGTTRDQINKIERKTQTTRLPRNIIALAKALEVSPSWLAFGTEELDHLDPEIIRAVIHLSKMSEENKQYLLDLIFKFPPGSTKKSPG